MTEGVMLPQEIATLVLLSIMVLGGKRLIAECNDAIQRFRDAFWGGPPPPAAPLPVDDSRILRRKRAS